MNFFKYILPTLGDFANGVFVVFFTALAFGVEVQWWWYLVGYVLAMLPDFDALPEVLRYGQVGKRQKDGEFAKDHRVYLHYPILFILGGIPVLYFSTYWGTVYIFAIILHFIRDILGTGWGVKLFWPLSDKNIKLFTRSTNDLNNKDLPIKSYVGWSDNEVLQLTKEYGDEDWLENTYLSLNWISGIEYSLFMIALLLMIISLV